MRIINNYARKPCSCLRKSSESPKEVLGSPLGSLKEAPRKLIDGNH